MPWPGPARRSWPGTSPNNFVYLTTYLALGPGDVVLTGAPGTYAAVNPGQRCTITLSRIGTLINPVRGR